MLSSTFAPQIGLQESSRLPSLARRAGISAAELACLVACGALAAFAVGFIHLSLRVPGHAILRGALPMAMGFALVPRRSAGIITALAAGITASLMSAAQVGVFPATSMLSVLALGPVLDLALLGKPLGWQLYVRFATAGAVANLLAFGLKMAGLQLGIETGGHGGGGGGGHGGGGGGQLMTFGWTALVSFLICGGLAGLVSGAVWFRARVHDDLRRN
ncbi:MAG TPA: hypothetical protein VH107_21110 [Lacipirellulaceae bacterium]|jgi:hypothetical protein|nr:hypothetical protein [Lacipirellulaceae bacterium]